MTRALQGQRLISDDDALWHTGWERWIAVNLLKGCRRQRLAERMESHGFTSGFAQQRLDEAESSSLFKVARDERERGDKMARLLDVLGELEHHSLDHVDERHDLPVELFYKEYVRRNRPVVLRRAAAAWPAIDKWSLPYFAQLFGDVPVEVTADRTDDQRFEDNFRRHVRRWPFSRFIGAISAESGNATYLVSKNRLLDLDEAGPLLDDFKPRLPYLEEPTDDRDAGLWVGPAGTVTPLHHDACNILFVQVHGRKRIRLVAPHYLPRLYNDRTCFSDFDPEMPDFERFPRMRGVPIATVELRPSDAVLIPVGWWHHVRSLDSSISLSFTQFSLRRSAHVWHWRAQEKR